jgi:hypothetical protein
MRTGIATIPLDYGRCPSWLFSRMTRLSKAITIAIVEEFGPEEFLRRLSDPIWFQSFGCVSGFDWNSSGLTVTTLGALKEALRGIENYLGIFVCGGKGKTSRKTPEQIQKWGNSLGFHPSITNKLVYSSRMSAKVDSSALQDGFNIYHHNLIFTKSGQWVVIQQGMNTNLKKARRYHWLSSKIIDYIEEPHSGIASDVRVSPLNLTAKESSENRKVSIGMVNEEPKNFLRNLNLIQTKKSKNIILMELNNVEFHWHPVLEEKFNLKRLAKIIFFANKIKPKNFEEFLSLQGVGPKTVRALSLVSELIYGAKASFEDPARYTFSFGGKDGTPYFVDRKTYDESIEILEKGIKKSRLSISEKEQAQKRLKESFL